MSGDIWKFSDQIDDVDVEMLRHETLFVGEAGRIQRFPLQQLHSDRARRRCLHRDQDFAGLIIKGPDLHAVHGDMRPFSLPEPYGPVDTRAGIPAAVGLIGVPDSDLHLVLLSVSEKCAGVRSQTVFICTQWVSVRLYLLRYAEELGKSK